MRFSPTKLYLLNGNQITDALVNQFQAIGRDEKLPVSNIFVA